MNTILINNPNNKQANVIRRIGPITSLYITIENYYSSSREAIDASIDNYENGRTSDLIL